MKLWRDGKIIDSKANWSKFSAILYFFRPSRRNSAICIGVVVVAIIALIFAQLYSPINNQVMATSQQTISKTTTADWDLGTTNNINTASDEMKLMPNPRTAWYSTGGTWNYRKKIVIDHTKVPNTDQTNFPVLINLTTDASLAAYAQDDGDDILITSENQTTKLSHEIELFNGDTGQLVLWVKIPTLSHTYDTILYMYYGNASCASQQSATSVWSNGYAGVWHMPNGTTLSAADSLNSYNGSIYGGITAAAGKVDGSASSDGGTGKYIGLGGSSALAPTNTITISAWVKPNNVSSGFIISNGRDFYCSGYHVALSGGNLYGGINTDDIDDGCEVQMLSTTTFLTISWYYVVLSYDSTSGGKLYVNGSQENSSSEVGAINYRNQKNLVFDALSYVVPSFFRYNGLLDDARLSNTIRSADWIAAEYANQNSPSTFYSLKSETAKSSVFIAGDNVSTDWYTVGETVQTDWKYRRKITVDHTKVPNTDQSEFPMLVKITDATDPIFTKAQADGDDILFTNSPGTTKLAHELEKFDTSTKALWAWVKIPTLATATDTVIWLYYGNASCSSQQNKTAVWTNGYAGVWHLGDAGPTTAADSTSNANNGTQSGGVTFGAEGKVGPATSYDGNDDRIDLGNAASLNVGKADQSYTLSAWAKINVLPPSDNDFPAIVKGSGEDWEYMMGVLYDARADLQMWKTGANPMARGGTVSTETWVYLSGFRDTTAGVFRMYLNGSLAGSGAYNATDFTAGNAYLAYDPGSAYLAMLNGAIDEARISNVTRSADWITTEYNNQNSPGTFASISKESAYYPSAGAAGWYATGGTWSARQKVTIDHTKVPNTDQTDFPVLIKITNQSNGVFASAQADGDDILFTSSNGTTKLSHEIETFDPTTVGSKALWAWVKVPTLATATDTVLYMYYGNPSCASQQSAASVWSNGYVGVWHSNNATTTTIADSTSNANTGTKKAVGEPVEADGKIGKAQNYDGNDYIHLPSLSFTGDFTIQCWAKMTITQVAWTLMSSYYSQIELHIFPGSSRIGYIGGSGNPIPLPSGFTENEWHHFVISRTGSTVVGYIDAVSGNTVSVAGTYGDVWDIGQRLGGGNTHYGPIDESRMSNSARSADWIATEYNNQNSPETFYSLTQEQSNNYYASPTSTGGGSGIINTIWNGGWGTPNGFASNVTIPANTSIKYQIRSSAVGGSSDGDWTAWADLGTATSTGTYTVANASMPAITLGTNKYLQIRSDFISDNGDATPVMADYTIYYLADVDPPTNPTTVTATVGGGAVTSGTWINTNGAFNFVFSGASDGGAGESGVAGYYVYLGTNASADPAVSGTYQAHVGAIGDDQNYNSTIVAGDDGKHFYFRLKTKDVAGNISAAGGLFDLGYDITLPTRPTFIASDPAGYTTTNSFTLSWPAGSDPNGPNGGASGIKWYEYKRATDGAWSHTASAAERTVAGVLAYQEGANAFYVRTIDNASNTSSDYQQVTYYWSGVAPAKPTGLEVTPGTSDTNSFTIHWHKPAVGAGDPPIVGYYYSINATPTIANVTYVASQADITTIGPDAYATIQGVNTIYVLSVNEAGNRSFEPAYVASTTFTCVTTAPPIPTSVSLYDSSDRTLDRWMLTIQWVAGAGQDPATFDHYAIYRSTNGIGFSLLATTTATAYIDASGLNNTTTYYYNVKAVDNAAKESAQSSTVSKMPTGNYTSPPTLLANPSVTEIKATGAKISWSTDRSSSSIVRYGTSPGTFSASTGQFDAVTSHIVTLLGLNPGTTHYFQVQSLDENRDYSQESAYSTTYTFSTLPAPAISGVKVANITLTTADISWETTTVAHSVLNYGLTNAYGASLDDQSGSGTTSHNVKLSSLTPGTTYHFKIQGTDADNNILSSDDYQFDTLPLPKIENLRIESIPGKPQSAFKASWTTNVPTSTIIKYRLSSESGDQEQVKAKLETGHSVEILGLDDDSTYFISAQGRDSLGNLAQSGTQTFKTPLDTRSPEISNVTIESTFLEADAEGKNQIIVSWETDEPATSLVEFGEGIEGGYTGRTTEESALVSKHLMTVSGLDSQRVYHFHVISKDKAGNKSESENQVVSVGEGRPTAWQAIKNTLENIFGFLKDIIH